LSRAIEIVIGRRTRQVRADELPLTVGGPDADLPLLGVESREPVALVGLSDEQFFLQPHGNEPVVCNGTPVTTARWLYHDDVVRIGANRIEVELVPGRVRFTVEQPSSDNLTIPPATAVGRSVAAPPRGEIPTTVAPVEFRPLRGEEVPSSRRRVLRLAWLVWIPLALLSVVSWWLLTSRSVEIVVEPEPDQMSFRGGLSRLGLSLDGRHLVRPGTYALVARKEGYVPLEVDVQVTRERNQSYRLTMVELPGYLVVDVGGVQGARVLVDEIERGTTPLGPIELPAGDHELRILAGRYAEHTTRVAVEGRGTTQSLKVTLLPRWAEVTVRSQPAGATILADGEDVGLTPATVELIEGNCTIDLALAGHDRWSKRIDVVAGQPQTLPTAILKMVHGRLAVRSAPTGAMVTVDGEYRGVTPLELHLPPGPAYEVELSKAGHEETTHELSIPSGRTRELDVTLSPRTGEVTIVGAPDGATLFVNGESLGAANRTLQLIAVPQQIEVRKEGHESFSATVTPRPGLAQEIAVTMKTVTQIREEKMPPVIRTSQDQELVLIRGGRFRMGASRREPGRRANETLREVELTRPFYIAVREISNDEFDGFRKRHRSGTVGLHNLEIGHHPVVRVTWEDAARFCNWLSVRESLPPAYVERGGTLELIRPATTGFRLPTEAEWTFVARYPDGTTSQKYPWGDSLPLPAAVGNYGDGSAESLLFGALPGYDDGHPATAPVGSFAANALGLFDLGGNVAEWVSDYYTVYPSRSAGVDRDPLGPESGSDRVVRGSSWMDTVVAELRLSYREAESDARPDLGFRIARYAE
jgi:formylglycine-generating enzyme required for sulfatase activity